MHDETLLAFDFGLQRIGVALGEVRLGQARALTCIAHEANAARFAAISELITEWQPTRLLVGRPLNDDGSSHDMTARCTRFANQLRGRFALPVEEVDERFSSIEADADLRNPQNTFSAPSHQRRLSLNLTAKNAKPHLGWQDRKTTIDAEAARVILQSWLETHAHQTA
ncbi:MAG TPA: Holliday junction resolvase RuvX [Rugosibacter sp.]